LLGKGKYIIGILSGCFVTLVSFYYYLIDPAIPYREQLEECRGHVEYVNDTGRHRSTVRFKLVEAKIHFVYHSVAGESEKVFSILNNLKDEITILYDSSESHSAPLVDSNQYYTVYEVRIGNQMIRSYDNVKNSYGENSKLAGYMSSAFFVLTILLYAMYKKGFGIE
jgi:hypothetical protein